MKVFRRLLAAAAVLLVCSTVSFGQVMSQVPANAMVVVHVKNPRELSNKIASLVTQLGLPPIPPFNDLLGALTAQIKAINGINKTGDMAMALAMGANGMNGPTPPIIWMIPSSDYKAFLGNYPDATTDGAISTFKLPDGQTVYSVNWGDYIALSPSKDLVSGAPGGLVLTAAAAKEVDAHDVTVVVNLPAIRTLANPLLLAARSQILTGATQAIRQTPYAKYAQVFRVGFNEGLDFVSALLNQCDDVTLGLSLTDTGIATTVLTDFKPDSEFGQLISQEKNTDGSLLAGLPEGKYLVFGGETDSPKIDAQLFTKYLDPIAAELTKMGPDGQIALDYITTIEAMSAAQTGITFGAFAPEGELGASPMLQFVALRNGDAKALSDGAKKMVQLQLAQYKSGGMAQAIPIQMSGTDAAKTIEGVSLDQVHVGVDMAKATTPDVAKISSYISFVYGTDGMNIYSGTLNDATYIQMAGMTDEKMGAAIVAAKGGAEPLAKRPGVVNTAGQLPKQRLAAMYVPLDTLVNTVFSYAAKFGLDMGVTMPDSDPVGITVSTDGSAARFDTYVPLQIVTNATKAATKLMAPHAAPGGPAGGPPAGGGL